MALFEGYNNIIILDQEKRPPSYNLHDIKKYYSDKELLSIIDKEVIQNYLRKLKIGKLNGTIKR